MASYETTVQPRPVEVYRRDGNNDKAIPPETLAILNTRPACVYERPKIRNSCKKDGLIKPPFRTDYDYTSPYITYRKFRSNLYRKNKGHMVVSGDRYVHQNLTRSYIFHRPPFDWYDASKADILDDIEEVVPIAGTLDKVHSKDIYSTPNFIANHHMLNLHNNRLNLTDESEDDYDDEYEEYVGYHNGEPRLMRRHSSEPRTNSRVASRPINPEDDVSDYEVPKSRSFNHHKEESRRIKSHKNDDDEDFRNSKNKFGNKAPPQRRFYKNSEEVQDDYERRRHVNVNSYSDFKSINGNLKKSEEFGEYVQYKEERPINTRANNSQKPLDVQQKEYVEYEEKHSCNLKAYENPKVVTIRSLTKPNLKPSSQDKEPSEPVKPIPYPYSIYSESTAKIFNQKVKPIKQHEGLSSNNWDGKSASPVKPFKYENNKIQQVPISENKSNKDNVAASQIIKGLLRVHMSDNSNNDSDIKYY